MQYSNDKKMLYIDDKYKLDCENKINYISEAKQSNNLVKSIDNIPKKLTTVSRKTTNNVTEIQYRIHKN